MMAVFFKCINSTYKNKFFIENRKCIIGTKKSSFNVLDLYDIKTYIPFLEV